MQHKEPQQQHQQRGLGHSSTCCNNACCLGPQKAPWQGLSHSSTYGGKAWRLDPQTPPRQGLGHSSIYSSKARCLGSQTTPRQGVVCGGVWCVVCSNLFLFVLVLI